MAIAMMSINRYFFICANDINRNIFTRKRCIAICVSVYFQASATMALIKESRMNVGPYGNVPIYGRVFDPSGLDSLNYQKGLLCENKYVSEDTKTRRGKKSFG
ncbi:hypothetical protein MAR_011512 [Mya arenaria]|uniref:Uncharacterized protein n=1 Tax=Mya arenaria TaxID=6604 RepID=A0ABY7FY38_MYAAR|nr:hypothetical protein MAR_011512 [Mya arenaria]